MDIFKLLKTLNSAQSSWQISLAVVLAMISGFIPLITPLYFFIIFIAFTLNVPLVIFFLMSGVFAGLGTMLDPTFAQVGKDILTSPEYKELFTQMYNYAPTLWSSYNHTIVMGSTLISLALAIPLFVVVNILLSKFRLTLESKFKDSKYFSWLNPYSEEKLKEKPGVFRIWGGLLFITLFGSIAALILFLIDPAIKYGLEFGISKATNKRVHIEDVKSTLLEGSLELTNISVYGKGDSDVNVDRVALKLNIDHFLEKKLDFEIISFGNIFLKLALEEKVEEKPAEEKKEQESSSSVKDALASLKMPELPNIDNLLAKEGLESVAVAKNIKSDLATLEQKYKNKLSAKEQKEQIATIETRVKALEKKAKSIKSLDDINAIVKEAEAIKKESQAFQSDLKSLYTEYKKDKSLIEKHIKDVKTLPKADYEKLQKKYSLDSNGAVNFIGTHFSSSLEKYLRVGLEYYEYVKPYLADDEEATAEAKRLEGEWIHYASKKPYPDFVIRKLSANVVNNSKNYNLKIQDITVAQKLYGKPIKGSVVSKSKEYDKLYIRFEHNELGKDTMTTLNSNTTGYKLAKYDAVKQLSINNSVINENSSFAVTNYTTLKANVNANFVKTDIVYSASKTLADKTIASILANIDNFKINAGVSGTLTNPKIDLNSDLDKKLSDGFKEQLEKDKEKYKAELKKAINKEFKKQLGDIDLGEFNDLEKLLTKDGAYKAIEQQIEKKFSKKAMEKELKDKANAALKKEQEKLKAKLKKEEAKAKAKLKKEAEAKLKSLKLF